MPNQHNASGIAVYVPVAAKNSAAYWVFVLLCTLNKIAKPMIPIAVPSIVKAKRCCRRSEMAEMVMLNTNAQAYGGIERSCVVIAEWP